MNAPAKIAPPANTAIWDAVSKTDPAHTKKVNQRGGFTAISAHYQVMRATEQFGPVGIGWGYENGEPIFHDSLVIVPVRVWHGDRANEFGPVYGGAEWRTGNRLDSDAVKKAATDGLTKALSHLGFNADVFLGRFDDNKYVEQVAREFAGGNSSEAHSAPGGTSPTKPAKGSQHSALKTALREFVHEMNGCGDGDELSAFLATANSIKVVNECREKLPYLWDGNNWPETVERPEEFVPLCDQISKRQTECAAVSASYLNT